MTQGGWRNELAERLAAMVRGPERLREDIADEIADHLASHVEENEQTGIEQPWVEAERAFGDPKQVARDLRRVHLGDLIMFQRILAICMIVVAAATAVTAYFSWSSMTAMSERMIGATDSIAEVSEAMANVTSRMNAMSDETANQLKALNTQLEAMSEFERKTRPPSIRIFCYQGEKDQPLAEVSLQVEEVRYLRGRRAGSNGKLYVRSFRTNREGWMSTGPLEPGRYRVSYIRHRPRPPRGLLPGSSEAAFGEAEPGIEEQLEQSSGIGFWSADIDLLLGDIGEMHLNLQPDHDQTFLLEIPRNVTWDRGRMKQSRIWLEYSEAALQGEVSGKWLNGRMSCSRKTESPWTPFTVNQLLAGEADISLHLGPSDQAKDGLIPMLIPCGKHAVGEAAEIIRLEPATHDAWNVTGMVYRGSKDQSLGQLPMKLAILERSYEMSEYLVTTSDGRFASLPNDASVFKTTKEEEEDSIRILEWVEQINSSTRRVFRQTVSEICEETDQGAKCDLDLSGWSALSIDLTGYRNQTPPMRATTVDRHGRGEETIIDLVPASEPIVLYWKRKDEPEPATPEELTVHRVVLEGWHELDTYQFYMKPGTYELRFEIPGMASQHASDKAQTYVWKTSATIDTNGYAQVIIDFHSLEFGEPVGATTARR